MLPATANADKTKSNQTQHVKIQFNITLISNNERSTTLTATSYCIFLISFCVPALPLPSGPLRSSDQLDLFVPHVRNSVVQLRSFESIGPSLWNRLPLQSIPPSSLVVRPHLSLTSTPVFSLMAKCTGSASEMLMQREALYK